MLGIQDTMVLIRPEIPEVRTLSLSILHDTAHQQKSPVPSTSWSWGYSSVASTWRASVRS